MDIDIYAPIRAKRETIDWDRIHVLSDKRAVVGADTRVARAAPCRGLFAHIVNAWRDR